MPGWALDESVSVGTITQRVCKWLPWGWQTSWPHCGGPAGAGGLEDRICVPGTRMCVL